VEGITPGNHGKGHGLHSQERSSPQDQNLWHTAPIGIHRRSAYTARLPEDILKIKVDLIGYYRYYNTYYIAYYDIFLVTLPL
jgi:hypothetical protein